MSQENTMVQCENCGASNKRSASECYKCKHLLLASFLPPESAFPGKENVPGHSPQEHVIVSSPPARISPVLTRKLLWLIPLLCIIIASFFLVPRIFVGSIVLQTPTATPMSGPTTSPTPTLMPKGVDQNGIGVYPVDGETIGISDGSYVLDDGPDRAGKVYKERAAADFRAKKIVEAEAEWGTAHQNDTNDTEPLIYLQNQHALSSGSPYLTFVVGTTLGTKNPDALSRSLLQGAYIAQEECNDHPERFGGIKVRLLLAKSGSGLSYTDDIARQIVLAAKHDSSIVGVLGWSSSQTTSNVIQTLADAHIPLVGSSANADTLTGISPYYSRIATPNMEQGYLLARYIEERVKPQHLVVFKDPKEVYSSSIADSFSHQFKSDPGSIVTPVEFTVAESKDTLSRQVLSALTSYHPDLMLFTSPNIGDMITFLNTIPDSSEYANLRVALTAGYQLTEANQHVNRYKNLLFEAGAFPDAWSEVVPPGLPKPLFFKDYGDAFDPYKTHTQFPYTFSRPNSYAMLAYDAMDTLLKGSQLAFEGKKQITPDQLKDSLARINEQNPFQGITGVISFGSNGDPISKPILILRVNDVGQLQQDAQMGCFLVGASCEKQKVSYLNN